MLKEGRVPRIIIYIPQHMYKVKVQLYMNSGMVWRSWLRNCATSRKAAVWIPDGVTGIFYSRSPSDCHMALWSTQPLTELGTRNIF